jgi:tetratricopeptide (TPR) repeat protein
MMKLVLFVLAMMPAATAQAVADPVNALRSRLTEAQSLEIQGSKDEAIKKYLAVVASAMQQKAGDPASALPYEQIMAEAALHAATLVEPSCPSDNTEAVKKTISLYKMAQKAPESASRALAANNMAVFLWRCKVTDPDPREVMSVIPFDELNEKLRSSYRKNYALLDERYAKLLEQGTPVEANKLWREAAEQYRKALAATPADETALAAISGLLDKLPDRISFSASVADLLTHDRQARGALDFLLQAINSSPELSAQDCAPPLASLLRAFAAAEITVEEFRGSYAPHLDNMAAKQKMAALVVTELKRAYLERVNVITTSREPMPEDPPSQAVCRFPQAIVPIVSGLDRALAAPFQSAEGKSLRRFFPQFFALGETQSLSHLLEVAAHECERQVRPDLQCAGERLAAAWLLDPSNTSAAVGLALLSTAANADKNSKDFLTNIVTPFYASSGKGLKALYSEPSRRITTQLADAQKEDLSGLNTLLGHAEKSSATDMGGSIQLRVRTPLDGDRVVSGIAPRTWETVRIQTTRAAGEAGCPNPPARQSTVAATNAVTGTFSVELDRSLSKGETVCVYGVEGGVIKNAAPSQVAPVPFLHRSHTYISGGIFWSRVSGEQHLLPRAAFDKDFNLGRWGYDRYHERAGRPYPAVTTLVNVFAEWRVTTIAKGTTGQTGGNGIANVQSLEFGGYAPLFTRRTTWRFLGDQRAFFVAPLIKGGVDFFPAVGAQSAFASGARLGVLRLLGATGFVPPELQSYVDVVYGNSRNVVLSPQLAPPVGPPNGPTPQTSPVTRLQQLDVTGMVKVPETPFYVGFNATAGPGAKQTAIFAGLRVNLRRLIRGAPL